MSPVLPKLAPAIATGWPSTSTEVEYPLGCLPLCPMLGNGVGTNGAGGPGILHTLGSVAAAKPLLPFVTGVFGGLTATLGMIQRVARSRTAAARSPPHDAPHTSETGPRAYARSQA